MRQFGNSQNAQLAFHANSLACHSFACAAVNTCVAVAAILVYLYSNKTVALLFVLQGTILAGAAVKLILPVLIWRQGEGASSKRHSSSFMNGLPQLRRVGSSNSTLTTITSVVTYIRQSMAVAGSTRPVSQMSQMSAFSALSAMSSQATSPESKLEFCGEETLKHILGTPATYQ